MLELKANLTYTEVILKSRFIVNIYKISSVLEANDILAIIKKNYFDANHNCYCYILGETGQIMKASDDKEPSKTAGMPMLELLKKKNLTNTLAIVTRYFGGIKLGAGGLIRAYSGVVNQALKSACYIKKIKLSKYFISITYKEYHNIIDFLSMQHILSTNFLEIVNVEIAIKQEDEKKWIEDIHNMTNGQAKVEYLNEDFLYIDA